MKKYSILILISLLAVLFCGCGYKDVILNTPSNPMFFSISDHETYDCVQLEYQGKKYIPYCAASVSMCDKVIGYYNDDEMTVYVLSYKGKSSDEWIIDCIGNEGERVSGHNIGMLLREESVKEIPKELQGKSEYEWNK